MAQGPAKEAAREAAEQVAKDPDDHDWQGALPWQLKLLLAEDHALAEDLAGLLKEVAQKEPGNAAL